MVSIDGFIDTGSFTDDDRLKGYEMHQDEVRFVESRLLLFGNVFAELLVEHGKVVGLNYLGHETMSRRVDAGGRLIGFTQTLGEENTVEFEPTEVIHWKAGA